MRHWRNLKRLAWVLTTPYFRGTDGRRMSLRWRWDTYWEGGHEYGRP